MSIRSLTFQVVALVAIPAFAAYHKATPYDFTFSSFAREGAITLQTEVQAGGTGYHLGEETESTIVTSSGTTTIQTPVFDRAIDVTQLVEEGQLKGDETERPIAYIPQDITLKSISIVTPGNVAPEFLILTLEGETTCTLRLAEGTETITLYGTDANGTVGTCSGVVHTYNVASGDSVTLNPGTEHSTFSVAFQSNDAPGQAQNRNVYLLDGRPFLRIAGTAEITHHVFKIDQSAGAAPQSLKKLLEAESESFVDAANTVVVVDFEGEGGGVSLDKEVLKSPIVFGSSVTPDKAHVHFPGTVKLESALTFRDGASKGGISIYGPTDTANYEAARWNPSALLLRCDVALCTPLPPLKDSWFLTHSTTIPAGRTFRLDLPSVTSEANLPNLDFADATSRLELASSIGGQTLAPKYLDLMTTQSGTLVLDRDVTYSSNLMLRAKAPGLNTTIIQKSGTFSCRNFYVLPSEDDANTFESFTFLQEGGTFEVTGQSFTIEATQKRIQVGPTEGEGTATMTLAVAPSLFEEGSNTVIDVNKGGTLTLTRGLDAGDADTTATLDLTVAGTLQLSENLAMTPALRRTLTLAGGTIASTVSEEVRVTCGDGGTSDGEGLLDIVGGGTLTGSLVVDAAAGQGDLALGADTTLKTLRDFTGTVSGTVSGAGRLEAIEGTLGDVTLGEDWITSATTGKTLGDVLTGWKVGDTAYAGASGFSGTIGFTAGTTDAKKTLDFSDLDELTSLGMAFRVANHQHIIMRLDQYADAVIRWPDNPEGITLTLIESGAYGGELTLPHFPHTEDEDSGVTFEFAYFNPDDPLGYTVRTEGEGYTHGHSEDGVNDTLVWDNPVFTGEGAWIDIEFNGDTRNTGWFTLWDQNHKNELNGLLRGDGGSGSGAIMTDTSLFSAVAHPADDEGGLALHHRPYVSFGSLEYPEEWSVAVRLTAPSAANRCLLALGNNTLVEANVLETVNSIVFATGKTGNEIVCYRFTGTAAAAADAIEELFRVTLPDIQDTAHVFSVVCEGRELRLYMDGAWLSSSALPEGWNLGCGLQVGAQLGERSSDGTPVQGVPWDFWDKALPITDSDTGGVIDYLRFYKGVLTDVAMVEMADRTPAVRENLRYVRYVPISTDPRYVADPGSLPVLEDGETWRQTDAWREETWNGSAWESTNRYTDEPAEGAYIRLLVDEGDHALQVNVERRDDAYFYSPDRNYAALVVEPQEGNAAAGTVRLIPYGVNPADMGQTGDALTQAIDDAVPGSAWFTTTADLSDANNTGFQYGKLRFTGGAGDPINDDPAITEFHGAGYLIDAASVGVNGIYDAGVCYLSKYGNVGLLPNGESSLLSRLTMVAGMSLTRGMVDEVARWQLTGPVVVDNATPGSDYILGNGNALEDQVSKDVWVPVFTANSTWKFYDDTRVEGGEGNANGALTGLFARGVQTPGRLYLDFTVGVGTGDAPGTAEDTAKPNTGDFSKQAWYRYGYEANQTTSTLSGMKPVRASADDFDQAVAFQIRLSKKTGDVTLTLDEVPTARVQVFYVEEEADAQEALTLRLVRAEEIPALEIWKSVVAAARLDVSNNNTGVATGTSWKGNALNLRPAEGIRTPVHRGNTSHNHGAYIVGTTQVDWDFGAASSVPRLEVIPGAELSFTVGQDFRTHGTTIVAQGKGESTFPVEGSDAGPTDDDLTSAARIHHMSGDPFLGVDVELGEGAIFGFHAEASATDADIQHEGVVLSGELRLTGNATLRADYNNVVDPTAEPRIPHFTAAGGIRATEPGVTLIVDAPSHQIADGNENHVNWHSHTSKMTGEGEDGFRLWKTGPGTVTFYASEPPSVTGKVTVEEGTLAVTTATDTPIGAKGLHVKAGAILADNGRMTGTTRRLARIPDEQTLSGGGTVKGILRLDSGATYLAKQGEALTADGISVDDSLEADITIDLPDGTSEGEAAYEEGTPYLIANRAERNVRRRLLPKMGDERWDAIAWIDTGAAGAATTTYAARLPQVPAPRDYADNVPPDTIGGIIEKPLINQYQNAGHAYVGQTFGRTRAGNKKLNNDELSDALLCFTNISAFVDDAGAADGRKYVDGTNFYVGYEFGISRQALVEIEGTEYVVLEVSVESALEDSFPDVGFNDVQRNFEADFSSATKLSFVLIDAAGKAQSLDGKLVEEVTDMDGTPVEEVTDMDGTPVADTALLANRAATPGKRWFRIPLKDLCDQASDGNIRLRASATSHYAQPTSTR